MPIEMNLWRIEEDRPRPVVTGGINEERRLESILVDDIKVLGLGPLMLLGRQVLTDHGARIDLLALDEGGTLYVVELKRARTPREVVAQVLNYGSWARGVSVESLARVFELGPFAHSRTFHAAFAEQFDGAPPETINETHRLVIVAPELDDSIERIVEYLLEAYGGPINAAFFRYVYDNDSEYLGRSWFKDRRSLRKGLVRRIQNERQVDGTALTLTFCSVLMRVAPGMMRGSSATSPRAEAAAGVSRG